MELDSAQLRAFAAAIRLGSLDAAAAELHLTPSAVSQRLKALETRVGSVLFVRSRPLAPTATGEIVLRLAQQIEALTQDVRRELGAEADPPRVSLAVNADSLATWVLPALAGVPGVTFEIHRADQALTTELLRSGTAMAAITDDAHSVQGCTVTPLGIARYTAMASPSFRERWLPTGSDAELARAPYVDFDETDSLQWRWLAERLGQVADPPRHRVPSSAEFVTAVELGLGWGMVPELQAAPGPGLVTLGGDPVDVPLYWQQWRLRGSVLDAVADAVLTAARAALR